MGLLAWVMMGLALWHFTIWLPDRFWGGIVGALLGAIAGAVGVGLIIYGFKTGGLALPGRRTTHLSTALYGIPGSLIGLGVMYLEGIRRSPRAEPA